MNSATRLKAFYVTSFPGEAGYATFQSTVPTPKVKKVDTPVMIVKTTNHH